MLYEVITKIYSHTILLSGILISFGMLLSIAYGISIGKTTLEIDKIEISLDSS